MSEEFNFTAGLVFPSEELDTTLISLEAWALVNVVGADCRSYLQGQLTCDVMVLDDAHYQFAAHCAAKGKLWSNLLLFPQGEGITYLLRKSLCETDVAELKKYAVFSKVSIAQDTQRIAFGLAGTNATDALATLYPSLPLPCAQVSQCPEATILRFTEPHERYLIIATIAEAKRIVDTLKGHVKYNNSRQWQALEIEAGHPIIDAENAAKHLPQAANLQALDALNFTKGCYVGQEMVARAKYRGANKRAMFWLAGSASTLPEIGGDIEMQMGENWRRTGTVLSCVALADNSLWVQVILNHSLDRETIFRVSGDDYSRLIMLPLPYTLVDEEA